ncbi:Tyrosyl-tRNA synthetase [Methanosarcina barkeri str. Wiesmoor]|uniref:Tyrosine--tRNA ligase n=2 Tax=Methanosarcina barkeri TaxID=2208 RepID=SYY_METBF|nr:tyrosine--tRNA ligase [Methanosarcina barkeri]Q46BQ5.1 RecName: Full=Tyrosine--tRNA ligase; AltName: Full=Tyrosyl-tRNA synthetase; Short=TyrRS [Methanosarcina barkeri str. Fusaro]AKB52246.1 Tyrosyl-tRNA synthetase [Methanosarcina barkeri str. Wiesmoor]
MDRLDLIKRNVQEIVTEGELEELLNKKKAPRAYVGYEPSGKIHMGHVLTVNKLIDLQKAGFEITVLLADVHAYLNRKGTLEEVRKIADYNKRCFIALGLDKEKTNFVYGSDYQLGAEYMLNVLKLSRSVTLNRARRSMDEVGRAMDDPTVSQMVYPLMQAIDIAMLGVDIAVGGIDQRKIHMLARENLKNLGFETPICIHTPILLGLDGTKMASSKENFISVDDTEEEIYRKLKKAYCKIGDTEENPILALFRYHIFPRYETIVIERPEKFGGNITYTSYEEMENAFVAESVHPMDLKNSAAKYINEILDPVRKVLL